MVGKSGNEPPRTAAKVFKTAASGKPPQTITANKNASQGAKTMSPAPGGMSGGMSPPLGAKAAADRKQFAQQLASTKATSSAKPAPSKPKTISQTFNTKANHGRAKSSFNVASKSGGKSGLSR